MTSGQVILDVAVILVAARIGAALFESFGQPGVIGEIVAGITLGPTILGALPGDPSAGLFPPRRSTVLAGASASSVSRCSCSRSAGSWTSSSCDGASGPRC